MAKFGSTDNGYDPFKDITESLSALSEPAPPDRQDELDAKKPAAKQQVPGETAHEITKRAVAEPATTTVEAKPAADAQPAQLTKSLRHERASTSEPQHQVELKTSPPADGDTAIHGEPAGRAEKEALPSESGGGARSTKKSTVSDQVALRVTKRFKTTREEAQRLDQAALRLAATLNTSVDMSKITRALWEVYLQHEEEILRSAPNATTRERPANNDAVGLAEFDEQLATIIGDGLLIASMRSARS